MTYKEAKVLLEATATNLLGDSCSVEDERIQKLMLKKYDAIDIAIEAIEKQIPKKPVFKSSTTTVCAECDTCIFISDKFCPRCGQAISWK